MSDLVERLRRQSAKLEEQQREYLVMDLMDQAADRIAELESDDHERYLQAKEIERLQTLAADRWDEAIAALQEDE